MPNAINSPPPPKPPPTDSASTTKWKKITDFIRFAEFGVMVTPALVVDGKLKVAGRIPSDADLEKMLQS